MISLRMEWIISWFLAQNSAGAKDRQRIVMPNTSNVVRITRAAVVHNASKRSFEINLDSQLSTLEYTFKTNSGSEA
jgi:hypothetical protein